jgi:hydrogenase maturation protease
VHDTPRILIACVGNVLRLDDGFGYAVAAHLHDLPEGVELLETGIGGMTLVQELMRGCDGLVIVDAVDRGGTPGTVFVIEPDVDPPSPIGDIHLANPDRVLSLARGLGCLPPRLVIVGCQPAETEGMGERLSPAVAAAVEPATEQVRQIVGEWAAG